LPALLLLRRESSIGDTPFRLRFNLVDEDGHSAGLPHNWLTEGVFPEGKWIYRLLANITFEFPAPGNYRLDITPDEGLAGEVYHYNITITERVAV
jgi:hypothetical protein